MLMLKILDSIWGNRQQQLKLLLFATATLGAVILLLFEALNPVLQGPVESISGWFYILLDTISIAIVYTIYVVRCHQPASVTRRKPFWIGIGFLTTEITRISYRFSYANIPRFFFSPLHKVTYFCATVRLLFAVVALAGSFLGYERINRWEKWVGLLIPIGVLVLVVLFASVSQSFILPLFSDREVLPSLRWELTGLSVLLMLIAGGRYWQHWQKYEEILEYHIVLALIFATYGEVLLGLPGSSQEIHNMLGLFYRLISQVFLYIGFVVLPIRRPYEELSLVYDRVRKSHRMLLFGQMSSKLNHEARNFLASIKGCAQLGKMVTSEPRAVELFERIDENVDEFSRVSSRMDSFSRPRVGEESSLRLVNLKALLHHAQLLWEIQLERKNIALKCRYETTATTVYGDCELLEVVLDNLIFNAIYAVETVGGGTIDIVVREGRLNGIPSILLAVSDNRFEISATRQQVNEDLSCIEKEDVPGLGMCKDIIEQVHRGRLWLTSDGTKGTTVCVEIPLARFSGKRWNTAFC